MKRYKPLFEAQSSTKAEYDIHPYVDHTLKGLERRYNIKKDNSLYPIIFKNRYFILKDIKLPIIRVYDLDGIEIKNNKFEGSIPIAEFTWKDGDSKKFNKLVPNDGGKGVAIKVDPKYKGAGIGTEIIKYALNITGYDKVYIDSPMTKEGERLFKKFL